VGTSLNLWGVSAGIVNPAFYYIAMAVLGSVREESARVLHRAWPCADSSRGYKMVRFAEYEMRGSLKHMRKHPLLVTTTTILALVLAMAVPAMAADPIIGT
jgi:hypothetical protein